MGGIMDAVFGSAPPAPMLKEPSIMPTADDAVIRAAKKKATARQLQRSGRASTILSGDDAIGSSETLG